MKTIIARNRLIELGNSLAGIVEGNRKLSAPPFKKNNFMGVFKNIAGFTFGRLTAVKRVGQSEDGKAVWLCRCECENETKVRIRNLQNGNTRSCGCLKKEKATTHGLKKHSLWGTWNNMKQRCGNKNNKDFRHYGGRGIAICNEWHNDFKMFYDWAISNGWQKGLTIDRVDNNGNYEPNNCRWVTMKEQNRNQRSRVKKDGL